MFKNTLIGSVFLLCLILSAAIVHGADMNIFLSDEHVAESVDIDKYLSTGDIKMIAGKSYDQRVRTGPAPAPYPQVRIWKKGIERLGHSQVTIDGIRFHNTGTFWVAKKWALVIWKVQIPEASLRNASEFEEDLTLSLWVDWNQDEMWGKNEKMICSNVNLHEYFPTDSETINVYYLARFRIADIDDYMTSSKWQNKDLRNLWIRGALSFDDPDVSPDGHQLFGEVEDYQITYMVTGNKIKEQ